MLRIIIKNLWNCRSRNAWLFAELIIVTVLTWVILDPSIVGIYDINSYPGYDPDRIVNIEIDSYPPNSSQYDDEYDNPDKARKLYENLISKASHLPYVESVTDCFAGINGSSSMSISLKSADSADKDMPGLFMANFDISTRPLTTYGLEAAEGSPSIKELESRPLGTNELIITEAVDRAYWPDRRGINGKRFIDPFRPDTAYLNVVGIIKDVRYKAHVRTNALVIRGATPTPPQYINELTLVVRLQEGIDADSYFNDHHDHITEDLSIGNFFVRSVKSQRQLMEEGEYICGITSKRDIMLFVATLFLLNLVLGVTGSVWLQTGKRINELGVLRSYGASRSKIMKMLFGEALVLASAAFVIGEIIYLQYAFSNNLSEGFEENSMYLPTAS